MGKDSGPSQPAQQTVTSTSIPEYARPYVERMLGKAEALSGQQYQPYQGQRIAGFDPMQQEAFKRAGEMQTSAQLGQASGIAQGVADAAQKAGQYTAGQFDNQYRAPAGYQAGQFTPQQVQAMQLQQYQMGPAERVSTQSVTQPGSLQAYMSPYMQDVVAMQQRDAARQSGLIGQQNAAQAAMKGAFGGSGAAFMEAERQRNLSRQLGDIQATGSQAAFQQAQQQFNAEQAARLQAQLANQQAGLTVGQQNLAAQLGVQQLGAQQGLQAQLANQQAGMEAQRMAEQSRQFGYGQDMTAAQLAAQYGLAAQQAGEQSRQFGANLGLQALNPQLQAAQQLGALGQTEFGQQKDIINALASAGSQQQALEQQRLSQDYQDFQNQRNYPYQQLGFMSDMLRGIPLSQTAQSMYQAPPSMLSQAAGLGFLGKAFNLYKEGGSVSAPAGLAELAVMRMGEG